MTAPRFDLPGPGLTPQAYLELLAAGHDTGWWDERGNPEPWPEDFLDPDSGWQPGGGDTPSDPNASF
jgi:hypothetical protein